MLCARFPARRESCRSTSTCCSRVERTSSRASPCRRGRRTPPRTGRAGRAGRSAPRARRGTARRARSSASTPVTQSSRCALTLPKSTRFSSTASTPITVFVDLRLPVAAVDPEQARDAASPEQAERVEHQLGVAGGLDHDVEPAEIREVGGLRRDVVRAERVGDRARRLQRRRPDIEALEPQEHRREQADRAGAGDERALRLPRLARADRERVADAARADRRRLGEHGEAAERARDRGRDAPAPRARARARSRRAA